MYNILIVDDEKIVSDVLQQILSRFGHNVEIAYGGYEGMRMFENVSFDLVITDIRMPGINGHDMARYIHNSDRPNTPVIGISGTPWLLESGEFDSVLPKPFGLQALLDAVKNVMRDAVTSRRSSYGKAQGAKPAINPAYPKAQPATTRHRHRGQSKTA